MNLFTFYGSKVLEDPQEFIDEIKRILLGITLWIGEKADLATFILKDVAQVWYIKWRDNSPLRGGLVNWQILMNDFLDLFFPREMRETKVEVWVFISTLWNSLNCQNMLLHWFRS